MTKILKKLEELAIMTIQLISSFYFGLFDDLSLGFALLQRLFRIGILFLGSLGAFCILALGLYHQKR